MPTRPLRAVGLPMPKPKGPKEGSSISQQYLQQKQTGEVSADFSS
jgi:hypothetical protein